MEYKLPSRLSIKPEAEIRETWKVRDDGPLVSICCATYNHAPYIEDAICGFLAQETDFPFEIIIRDDASTDGTTTIVLDYAARYPNIVKAVINKENEFKRGIHPTHAWAKLASARYIALCEGDDFWISPKKLQKQVELLGRHQDAVMSVALTHFFQQAGCTVRYVKTTQSSSCEVIQFEELQKHYFHTSTYVLGTRLFKEIVDKFQPELKFIGDTALREILINYGPFTVLPEVVSVYRITGAGIWTSLAQYEKLSWEFDAARKLSEMLNGEHRRAQRRKLYGLARALFLSSLRSWKLMRGIKWGNRTLRYGMEEAVRKVVRRRHEWLGRI